MQRRLLILAITVALSSLLAPTLLCAMPTDLMGTTEHDCCEHAQQTPCTTSNMSACCTVVVTYGMAGTPVIEKKMSGYSDNLLQYVVLETLLFPLAISPDRPPFALAISSSPPIPITDTIQVLRV